MKKAVIFGASGFIGSFLLSQLLNDPDYEQVTIVVRKPLDIQHPKLKTLIGDFSTLRNLKDQIGVDEVFIAMGTTKSKTPDEKEYYQIDHDYPVLAARIARESGAKSVFIVTAVGANQHSKVFYLRTKGEVERDISSLGFEHAHFFRPSMLLGERKEHRALEKTLIKMWPVVQGIFVGGLSKYKGIEGRDVARAMIRAAKQQSDRVGVYEWKEMQ